MPPVCTLAPAVCAVGSLSLEMVLRVLAAVLPLEAVASGPWEVRGEDAGSPSMTMDLAPHLFFV